MKRDLTKGNILRDLFAIAIPIVGTQMMQMLYNLTDLFWLGRLGGPGSSLGADMVAASGTAGMYMWLANSVMMVGNLGASVGASHALGRGDEEEARSYSQNALLIAVVFGLLAGTAIFTLRTPLIGFYQIQEQHVVTAAVQYLGIVAIGLPFAYTTSSISGTFHAAGNSKLPFFINGLGLLMNMILDPILILTVNMGVIGAAVATITAQITVATLSVIALISPRTRPLGPYRGFVLRWDRIRQIFRWSLPVCLENLFFSSLSMLISRFISDYGVHAISVDKVGSQIESLAWMMSQAFSSALTAFVGQNVGARQPQRIARCHKMASGLMACWGAAVTVLMVGAGQQIFYLLLPNAEVAPLGGVYLKFLAICQISAMLEGVGSGTFRGSGNTLPASITSIVCNACRVVLAYGLSRTGLGLYGLWLGVNLGAVARGLGIYLWSLLAVKKMQTALAGAGTAAEGT